MGETIRINGDIFTVVGVLQPKMQESNDDINRTVYIPFNTMSDLKDTTYIDGVWIGYHGDYTKMREDHPRNPRRRAPLPPHRPRRHARRQSPLPAPPVRDSFHRPPGPALPGGRAHSRHRRHRPHEHHAGQPCSSAPARSASKKLSARAAATSSSSSSLKLSPSPASAASAALLLAYLVSVSVGRITFYSAIAKNAESADIRLIISPSALIVAP